MHIEEYCSKVSVWQMVLTFFFGKWTWQHCRIELMRLSSVEWNHLSQFWQIQISGNCLIWSYCNLHQRPLHPALSSLFPLSCPVLIRFRRSSEENHQSEPCLRSTRHQSMLHPPPLYAPWMRHLEPPTAAALRSTGHQEPPTTAHPNLGVWSGRGDGRGLGRGWAWSSREEGRVRMPVR
jgi:hypothetical protein